ncbi:hypothetical protein AVEN_130026-1 [Araneus ventricosus]|uniref:Uncharacterized protein n=1 Tax=Araneus ventricosus TaxID=182803 RepID=A0A4Y2Q262_ARAVE|nr:hypothetical protein AVEN_130026-1 [Araneus ventricosus]
MFRKSYLRLSLRKPMTVRRLKTAKQRPMHSPKRAEGGKELSNGERYVGKAREHLPTKRSCEKGFSPKKPSTT